MFGKAKKIHFIGIGGIGMSAIAEYLQDQGYEISGSDLNNSKNTERLAKKSIRIFMGHSETNITDCDVVIYSSAIQIDNPEMTAAISKNLPIIKRGKALNEICESKSISIDVSGTHGKTTTSTMTAHLFTEAGFDPAAILGGISKNFRSNARTGNGDMIVVEADEYDHSFLELFPTHAIITSLEAEHLDCYGSLKNLKHAFVEFANRVSSKGKVILCNDEQNLQEIIPEIRSRIITYGLSSEADIYATNISSHQGMSRFDVISRNEKLGQIQLPVMGKHNIRNCLASIAIALEFDIPFEKIFRALKKYTGIERRFDIIESNDQQILVDDYAHHPTEIKAVLSSAKKEWNRRIIAVFQPHLFSRTQKLYKEFGAAFCDSDVLIITDIYPAREKPIPEVTGKLVSKSATQFGHKNVHFAEDKNDLLLKIEQNKRDGDMIITLGAGDINQIHKLLVSKGK